ncbi:hypothetical protein N9D38_01935 [Rubripirellula sp.]|nr:hypothetical protein [Rubripirellula sp.]
MKIHALALTPPPYCGRKTRGAIGEYSPVITCRALKDEAVVPDLHADKQSSLEDYRLLTGVET